MAEFATDLVDEVTVRRRSGTSSCCSRGWPTLRGAAPFDAAAPHGAERAQLLAGWNDVELAECLHEAFAARAPPHPGRRGGLRQLAADLWRDRAPGQSAGPPPAGAGVGAETPVGVCWSADRSSCRPARHPQAGGAYVPLDPASPESAGPARGGRAGPRAGDAGCLASRFPSVATHVLMDTEQDAVRSPRDGHRSGPARLLHLYVGSTAAPGGGHQAPQRRGPRAMRSTGSARRLAGVLASTSICFDISIFELFVPLSRGARCCSPPTPSLSPSCRPPPRSA